MQYYIERERQTLAEYVWMWAFVRSVFVCVCVYIVAYHAAVLST